jgi:hypothetical protein
MGSFFASRNIQATNRTRERELAMPLNEKLIKHGIDDQEYAKACPTLGTLMLAHFSTPDPAQHTSIVYGADSLYFSTFPSRRIYLRKAINNEFDLFESEFAFEQCPKLWVLVTQLSPGFHEITPRWRGRAFWSDLETDQAVATVLIEMSLRNGISLSEWLGFIQDQRIRNADKKKKHGKQVIH